jgi:hypothetical protein
MKSLFQTDEYVVCFYMHLQAVWLWAGFLISFLSAGNSRLVGWLVLIYIAFTGLRLAYNFSFTAHTQCAIC